VQPEAGQGGVELGDQHLHGGAGDLGHLEPGGQARHRVGEPLEHAAVFEPHPRSRATPGRALPIDAGGALLEPGGR
jgi:hypothetical protein